ncbi:SIMPL domain-containing protein [Bosea minatitlanensis]|nr:SIMPL domain-containing protein [Bosea minatitlanensis]MCT4492530.1 SIMPL domain-containing protein [Bosea minatitlanensis]
MPNFFAPALAGATLFAAAMLPALPAAAQDALAGRQAPRISVVGEGEVSVAPDLAVVTLSVLREAATAREALTANNAAMKEVLDGLKAAGIAERDIQTSRLNIQPRYAQGTRDKPETPRIVGYSVGNEVTVRIRKIAEAGAVIDKVVGLGVNQGGSIAFVNEDLKATMTEARKRAVADALDKARTLAEAAGVKLGPVLSIEENAIAPRPIAYAAPMRKASADMAVPLASGENSYQTQVNVVFEIAR